MSAFLLGMGFRANMGTCARKLVLLKLIDACEDDGTRIFPAMATVARAAQCSSRQVQREIRAFQQIGLLRLVRKGGNGPRSTNEYALNLDVLGSISKTSWEEYCATVTPIAVEDDAAEKGDTVSPFENGEKGDTGDALRVTPATDKGDKLCHPTPQDSSTEPSLARAQVREGLREEGESGSSTGAKTGDDPRKFERRVKKLAETHNWPGWANSSTRWAVERFSALTDAERVDAETHAAAYIAACGRRALSLGVYFGERKWRDLSPEALAPKAVPEIVEARPFGKLWGFMRLREFLTVAPQAGPMPKPGSFLAMRLAQQDEVGQRERLDQQVRYGWPEVNRWHDRAQHRRGFTVDAAQAVVPVEMEWVPMDTAVWRAWEAEHQRRGWPWLPPPGEVRGAWMPVGGPDGLDALEAALRGSDEDESSKLAAQ